jgi:ribosomal protein S18 acetylase RimI-like enzyme
LGRALRELEAKDVAIVQCLLVTDAGDDASRLQGAGFEHSCDLLYLVSHAGHFPASPVATSLTFTPVTQADMAHLARIVESTYEQSLDCPALDRRRDCRDVVEGYRATCRGDLSHWYFVHSDERDIGCLLLSRDERQIAWELVYMGLTPAVRGRGWGIELVRHAQWLIGRQRGERLVLAVDAANEPAIRIYAAAGFVAWDRRSVFLKFLAPDEAELPSR